MSDPRLVVLRRVARRQRGIFTLVQARAAGFTDGAIRHRVSTGSWERLHRSVLREASVVGLTPEQQVWAAVLATGGRATGRSLMHLLGLVDEPPAVPGVLTITNRRAEHPAIVVTSTKVLPHTDVATVCGIPALTPARGLIELARVTGGKELQRAVDRAITRKLVTVERLRARLSDQAQPIRYGRGPLQEALRECGRMHHLAANDREAFVLRLCRRHGLPDPVPNLRVLVNGESRYIDAAWPVERVGLEFDGAEHHAGLIPFTPDRVRGNELADLDWLLFRLTDEMLRTRAAVEMERVARALLRRQP